MKNKLALVFLFISFSAFAVPLKFECNSMSIDQLGRYVKGKSNTGMIQDYGKTAFAVEVFREPFTAYEFIVKLENNACVFNDLVTIKNCSKVSMNVKPSAGFEMVSQLIHTFPQRNIFRTEKAHETMLDVYDADFHPIQAGVVTYDSKLRMAGFDMEPFTVKLFCIFRR